MSLSPSDINTQILPSAEETDEEKFHAGWREWAIRNLLLGAQPENVMEAMMQSGFSGPFAAQKIHEYDADPILQTARRITATHTKATDILDALCKLERKSPGNKKITVVRNLPAAEFYKEYYFRNQPVLLQGLTSRWKAVNLWTPEYFAARFGDSEVEIVAGRSSDPLHEYNFEKHKTRIQMKEYVRLVEEGGETNDYYMVAQNYLMSRPEFQKLYGHIDGLDGYFNPATLRGRVRFWFGPKGTVTQLHHDATPVMMGQIYGRKRVKLVSPLNLSSMYNDGDWISPVDPENVDYSRFPKMREVDILDVTLMPGELLFIPLGWWHWVKSLDVSISLSFDSFVIPRAEIEMAGNG